VPLPVGVIGHEGSTIIVVANGLRMLRVTRQNNYALPVRAPRTVGQPADSAAGE
jgi:hypothetical protein